MKFACKFSDTYDVLTVSAGFGEGHLPCSSLHEMVRVVKPGRARATIGTSRLKVSSIKTDI
jgi:hypothetical protein